MASLEKKVNDLRGKPEANEFFPLIGWYFAAVHKRRNEPNILDNSTVKPVYFFSGWGVHVISLVFVLSYIAYSLNM